MSKKIGKPNQQLATCNQQLTNGNWQQVTNNQKHAKKQ